MMIFWPVSGSAVDSAGQASAQQRRIVLGQIGGDGDRRAGKDRKKQPALPVMHRAGGTEEQHTHNEREQEICEPGFYVETDHDLYRPAQ
jgi:hypothetical protein